MKNEGLHQMDHATDKYTRADEIRSRMWGEQHLERMALVRKLTPELADVVLREFFGGVYADETLPLRERSLCTITCLATQGRPNQLRSHLVAALRLGVSPEELAAVLTHLCLYTGLPTVVEGLRVLDEVLHDDEENT